VYLIGKCFDLVSAVTGKRFAISSIHVKKFCANSVFNTAVESTGFVPPVPLEEALENTVQHEFIESHEGHAASQLPRWLQSLQRQWPSSLIGRQSGIEVNLLFCA
jgi:hypothetical protein